MEPWLNWGANLWIAGPAAVLAYLYLYVFEVHTHYRCPHKAVIFASEAVSLSCHSRYLGCGKPWGVFWKPGGLTWSFSWSERRTRLPKRRA